ncbi:hypothetical protein [Streptomyces oceani]|uniref:ATP-binding protein n=1 Tax=Streptomyces oceani TaxID=1075402 RepID=A0A1E7KIA5_9ACTN|nr:hypothetical protein [Streptomyces oceani]OEV03643.1 hypothetical protein AN216_10275 [Streptomyces oceani]
MKHGTIKTLGVTALGAAFAVSGAGAASAADLTGPVEDVTGGTVSASPLKQLTPGSEAPRTLPAEANGASDARSGLPGNVSADGTQQLLGGIPLAGGLTNGGLTNG